MSSDRPRIERMYVEILLGISQNKSLLKPLSPKEVEQWANLEADIKKIRAQGGGFIIPSEVPGMG